MLMLHLPPEIEARLDSLAKATGRTKSFYVREAILEHLEDMEDAYLASATLERVRRGKEKVFTTDQLRADLGLEDGVVRRAARYSSAEVNAVLFPQGAGKPRSPKALKAGLRTKVKRRHARRVKDQRP